MLFGVFKLNCITQYSLLCGTAHARDFRLSLSEIIEFSLTSQYVFLCIGRVYKCHLLSLLALAEILAFFHVNKRNYM